MNKILIAVFDTEAAAAIGLKALQNFHAQGDITMYAAGVMIKDDNGGITVKNSGARDPIGLAVGSMIGLIGGPAGLPAGVATGTVAGAVRDFWVAGVGLDFIDEAYKHLEPGKVALVAEIEEDWVDPGDAVLEVAGGHVLRRNRSELAQSWLGHDISSFRSQTLAMESELSVATGERRARLLLKLTEAKTQLDAAMHGANRWIDTLGREATAKTALLEKQLEQAAQSARPKIETRAKRVNEGYHTRGANLSKAWGLVKEAAVP